MDKSSDLENLFRRLVEGTASEADRQTLRESHLSLVTGTRAVAITGDAKETVIVTGDLNVIFRGGDAAMLRQAILALYPTHLHQLPADLPDFTGRDLEVEELLHLFLDCSHQAAISAVGGMGGVGKTALAVHVAHKLVDYYLEAQIMVDLAGSSDAPLDPIAVMGRVINAFEPQARLPESRDQVAALYRSLLANRRVLLLLDNAANAAQVRDLLPPPPSAALVTSRRIIILPGLTSVNLDVLPAAKASDLLRTILRERRVSDQEITALAERCGRLPLALRVAGSFLATHLDWKVGEYLDALTNEQEQLRRLRHEDLEVEVVLGLSAAQLARENPDWASRWQMLTVFSGSFDRAAVAAVWQVTAEEARDTLSELLTRSLVFFDPDSGRYRLHDLMRLVARNAFAYGCSKPDVSSEIQRLVHAAGLHAFYYGRILGQAEDLYLQGGEALVRGLQMFEREWENIRAGQAWASANAKVHKEIARMCSWYPSAGGYLLFLRLPPRECLIWLESALAAARDLGDRSAEGAHLGNLGLVYNSLGEYRRAIDYQEQRLAVARELGDRQGEGAALGGLGSAYILLGDYHRAIDYQKQRLAIARELGDRRGEGNALGNLGVAYDNLRDYYRAIDYQEQRLVIVRELRDRHGEGQTLGNIGNSYDSLGEYRRALEYYEQSLTIARQIGDRQGEANALGNLGVVYRNLGEFQRVIEYQEQRLTMAAEIDDRLGEANARWNMSLALNDFGQRQQAVVQAQRALEIYEQIESPAVDLVRETLAAWHQES
jgi:tetratricopeptide (TPR) repeat protein